MNEQELVRNSWHEVTQLRQGCDSFPIADFVLLFYRKLIDLVPQLEDTFYDPCAQSRYLGRMLSVLIDKRDASVEYLDDCKQKMKVENQKIGIGIEVLTVMGHALIGTLHQTLPSDQFQQKHRDAWSDSFIRMMRTQLITPNQEHVSLSDIRLLLVTSETNDAKFLKALNRTMSIRDSKTHCEQKAAGEIENSDKDKDVLKSVLSDKTRRHFGIGHNILQPIGLTNSPNTLCVGSNNDGINEGHLFLTNAFKPSKPISKPKDRSRKANATSEFRSQTKSDTALNTCISNNKELSLLSSTSISRDIGDRALFRNGRENEHAEGQRCSSTRSSFKNALRAFRSRMLSLEAIEKFHALERRSFEHFIASCDDPLTDTESYFAVERSINL